MSTKQIEKPLLPIFIRLKFAPFYLGMDKNRFNKEARPYLTEIRIGKQGIAFHRLEIDDFAAHYMKCNGRHISNREAR